MIEDVFKANKGKVGIVLYSVTGKKVMNGKPVTLSEGVLRLKDKSWVNRRSEVDKAVRSLLKQHAAKGEDPAGCSFYVVKEDGDVQLCSMAFKTGE
ncbi:MAG: hypothetical protein ACRYFS_02855 [Janthinobacterium lividum]